MSGFVWVIKLMCPSLQESAGNSELGLRSGRIVGDWDVELSGPSRSLPRMPNRVFPARDTEHVHFVAALENGRGRTAPRTASRWEVRSQLADGSGQTGENTGFRCWISIARSLCTLPGNGFL